MIRAFTLRTTRRSCPSRPRQSPRRKPTQQGARGQGRLPAEACELVGHTVCPPNTHGASGGRSSHSGPVSHGASRCLCMRTPPALAFGTLRDAGEICQCGGGLMCGRRKVGGRPHILSFLVTMATLRLPALLGLPMESLATDLASISIGALNTGNSLLRGGVAISSFIVGSIQQAKHA